MKAIHIIFIALLASFQYTEAQTSCQRSFKFSGSSGEMIALPTDTNLYSKKGFTWEAWIKPTNIKTGINTSIGQVVVSAADLQNCADIGFAFGWGPFAENELVFTVDGSGCVRDPNPPRASGFVNGHWYHVAAVCDYNNGVAYLYVDGILRDSSDYFAKTPSYLPFTQIVTPQIGNLNDNNKNFAFQGNIDDVRIWNTPRTISQIAANMYACLPTNEPGLMGYYRAQNNSATIVADSTIYNRNGKIVGTVTYEDESPEYFCCKVLPPVTATCRQSFQFNGAQSEVIRLPTDTNLYSKKGFTWEAWIQPTNIKTGLNTSIGQVVLSAADLQNCADIGFGFGWGVYAENEFVFTIDGNGCVRDPNPPRYSGFLNGRWYHVAGVCDYNAGSAKLYVNGVLVSSSNYFAQTPSYKPFDEIVSIQMGNLNDPNKNFAFEGNIDEVRIWNVPRTAAQILDNRFKCLDGNLPGLMAYYKAQEDFPGIAVDSSIHKRNGNMQGTISYYNNDGPDLECCETEAWCLGSFEFSGTSGEEIYLGKDTSLYIPTGFSWEAWIFPDTLRSGVNTALGHAILTAADLTNCDDIGLCFGWASFPENTLVFAVDGAGCNRDPNPPTYSGIVPKQWYHIAAVADYANGNARLYVDGNQVSSSNYFATGNYTPFKTPVDVQIGNIGDNNKNFAFDGLITEVRIWSKALTSAEVLEGKDRCLTGSENGLVSCYAGKDVDMGDTVKNKASNNFNGIIAGMVERVNKNPPIACCGKFLNLAETEFLNLEMDVFPNPATQFLNFNVSGITSEYTIAITNLLGQQVWQSEPTTSNTTTVDVSSFTDGLYVASIHSGNRTIGMKKVLLQIR